ncbi:putative ww domain containing oxidoreductase protein [Neofusicoccum parvum UCRNP2]|uniref:Putative ww domain containing oxidoreductase protein n=1 Tax=Botryosphaeria parva (strain UCR-NP2) TaxID=1287680 RepID=R1GWP8_BOTPV|nr:putative ww domain containing oxidoreductase protein [Neofusicoccum parvum UCRNP2]
MSPPYGFHTTATEVASDLSTAIRGKTVLTTGVTPNSLGAQFVSTIAAHAPALLILASRTQSTIDATAAAIAAAHPAVRTRGLLLDLGDLASARAAGDAVAGWRAAEGVVVDVLVLNAGVMACPYGTTADGFERQFGTNHLGHFVFGNRVVPAMLGEGRAPRVVVVSSEGHQLGPVRFADPGFKGGECYDKWRAYGQAKTANNLYALSLAEKLVATFRSLGSPLGFPEYWEKNPFKTHDEGTATHVFAAFADGLEKENGKFLIDAQVCSWDMVSPWARNSYDAERLWKMSEEMVGEKFDL